MTYPSTSVAEFIVTEFEVVIDTREQAPFTFQGIKGDSSRKNLPIVVRTRSATLQTGDYSITGHENRLAIERKSLEDLYSTLSSGRERFERELYRLNSMPGFSAVVVEAGWGQVVGCPPQHTKVPPKAISRSILAFNQRFRNVHWYLAPDRRFAEILAFRILDRYWRDWQDSQKPF